MTDNTISNDILEATDGYDPNLSMEQYVKDMTSKGYTILTPEKEELFLDIDTEEQLATFTKNVRVLRRIFPNTRIIRNILSESGSPHRHITVHIPIALSDHQRIAFQAALGSDPMKELLSLIRIEYGITNPVLLAEKR